ncbi:MAG TPA: PEP-CTERM sorting domain-containing protein [Candidatus Acidoferrum sp.]|nr:PEP-CTERM sorting domain-containing protein [Candidatus Acidoferrum sp.]
MKEQSGQEPKHTFTPESQTRLLAYTTAAGLGAFFGGQNAEAAPALSLGLAPYPHTLVPGMGTGYYHNYFYFDVDGDGTPDFNLGVNSRRIDISGYGLNKLVLNPSSNGYVIPWTAGSTVNSATGTAPTYHRWLANTSFVNPAYDFNNFSHEGAMGFQFTSSISGSLQTYFGYVDLQVNGDPGSFTVTVDDIYWETVPNTGIQVQAVPEPSSLALLAAGVAGLALRRARRERSA